MRFAFGTSVLTLLLVGSFSYRHLRTSAEGIRWVRHTHEVIEDVQSLRYTMGRLDMNCREFVWSDRNDLLQSCQTGLATIPQQQARIRELTRDNPVQQRQLALLEAVGSRQIQNTKNAIYLRQANSVSLADIVRNAHSEELTEQYEAITDKLRDEELRLLVLRDADYLRNVGETESILIGGTLLGILMVLAAGRSADRDGSARGSAEEALRDSEEQHRLLLNGVHDYAIFMVNPQGIIVSWNAGAERIKGYTSKEIIGSNYSIFFVPEDQQQDKPGEILRLTTANGRYEEFGMRVRKDGSAFPADVILTALRDANGELRGFSEVTRDMSKSEASEARYRGLLEAAPDAMIVVDQEGIIVLLNLQAEQQFGYTRDELLGKRIDELIPEGFAERLIADELRSDEDARTQQIGGGIELCGRCKDGAEFPIEIMLSPLRIADGTLVTAAIRNITNRKRVEEAVFVEKELAQVTLNCMSDAIASTDTCGNTMFLNLSAQTMTGCSMDDAIGRPIEDIFSIVDGTTHEAVITAFQGGDDCNGLPNFPQNCLLVRRDGSEIPIEHSIAALRGSDGRATGSVIVFRDVSVSRGMAVQMSYAAEHDFLTNLPNRLLLNDRIGQAIALASRNEARVAIMFLDLDGFKHINDSLGHPIGDKLLQLMANRLLGCVRPSDTVSRQGGDEFVIMLAEMVHPASFVSVAGRLLDAVAEVCHIDSNDLHLTASIGVSIYPDDGLDAETLLKNADTAMYQAKEGGRQSYRFFEAAMNVRAVERQSIEESLRRALQNKEFTLNYQPKVDLKTGEICGAEALIRWTHPSQGPLSPAQFIPIAESCGLILPIGRWVLREACTQARAWADAGLPAVKMAVNISALDFRDEHFLASVFSTLEETGWEPGSLELELTESVLMKRADDAESTLKALRARGVKLAVDDFGTGYSSLGYLSQFSIDTLKIDQSFIRQLSLRPDQTTIVASMINMGRSLKLRVVAEGVENIEELRFLQDHDCDEVQGYYFSRPVPPHQFAMLLESPFFPLPDGYATIGSSRDTLDAAQL